MNNKGFAISGILYGVLILFLTILLSILHILVIRINRLTSLVEQVTTSVEEVGCISRTDSQECITNDFYDTEKYQDIVGTNYTTKQRGKYEIKLNDSNICYAYLPKNIMLVINDGIIKYAEAKDGVIDKSNLNITGTINLIDNNGNNCSNSNITTFEVTKIYSAIYK